MAIYSQELRETSERIEAQSKSLVAKVAENMTCDTLIGVRSRVYDIHTEASRRENLEFQNRRNRDAED